MHAIESAGPSRPERLVTSGSTAHLHLDSAASRGATSPGLCQPGCRRGWSSAGPGLHSECRRPRSSKRLLWRDGLARRLPRRAAWPLLLRSSCGAADVLPGQLHVQQRRLLVGEPGGAYHAWPLPLLDPLLLLPRQLLGPVASSASLGAAALAACTAALLVLCVLLKDRQLRPATCPALLRGEAAVVAAAGAGAGAGSAAVGPAAKQPAGLCCSSCCSCCCILGRQAAVL
jgi:hypothetical protein